MTPPEFQPLLISERGTSLLSLIIAVGLSTLVMAIIASIYQTQDQEMRSLKETTAAIEFQRMLEFTVLKKTECNQLVAASNLVNPGITINLLTVSSLNPQWIDLKAIPPLGVNLGEAPSPMSNSLVINPTNGIRLKVTSARTASLEIQFDLTRVVRGLRNIQLPLRITTSGPPNAAVIATCGGTT